MFLSLRLERSGGSVIHGQFQQGNGQDALDDDGGTRDDARIMTAVNFQDGVIFCV
jgi:hypothetical protein